MYELVVLNTAARQLRKFDEQVKIRILYALEKISNNPYCGEVLKGDLSAVYAYHMKIKGVEYRISYQIKEQEIVVVVLQIGTRENFYEELKKRLR